VTDVTRFLEALRRQEDKYGQMVALVEEQKKLLSGSDVDALMGLLERKRSLLAEIEELEKDLADTRERWAEVRATLDAETVRRVEEAVEGKRRVLEKLVRMEDEGQALMRQHRASTAEELKGLMKKKKARGAYGGSGESGARFYDDKK
jgi:flagellar biosynthesis/type III secretory pathway chaperone